MSSSLVAGFARSWWVLVLYGVVAIAFGLYALAVPAASGIALAWAFGVMAIAEGVASVFALPGGNAPVSRGWLMLYALVSIVFGVLAIMQPVAVAGTLLMFLAAWLIVAGIWRIVFAIRVRKWIPNEWALILGGVLAIVLGVLFVAYPIAGLLAVMLWIGAGALVYGVLQVIAGFRLRKLA